VSWGADRWPAPAKLNLFLHILGRRADGYHELQTAFQLLDYGDSLSFEPRHDDLIRRIGGAAAVAESDDLAVRAARLLRDASGVRRGVTIRVDKRLPLGGGLGGGSTDAATTLVALNRLWGVEMSTDALAALGLRLGADIPVFVRGRSAWAEGVGERLMPLELPETWYAVVFPDVQVSTAAVFRAPELTRNTPRIKIAAFRSGRVGNDCLAVVRGLYPQVDEALRWLGQFGEAKLTGTGACVFAAFPTEEQARAVAARVHPPWQAFAARGVMRSPLCDR